MTICQNEAEVKCQMDIDSHIIAEDRANCSFQGVILSIYDGVVSKNIKNMWGVVGKKTVCHNVRGLFAKKMCGGGGVQDFFQSIPAEITLHQSM